MPGGDEELRSERSGLWEGWAQWRLQRRALADLLLNRNNDHLLRDAGLSREEGHDNLKLWPDLMFLLFRRGWRR